MRILLISLLLSISSTQCMYLEGPTASMRRFAAAARSDMASLDDWQINLCKAISQCDEQSVAEIVRSQPHGKVDFSCPLSVEAVEKSSLSYTPKRYPLSWNCSKPICRAAKNGSLAIVKLLLNAGAQLNGRFAPLVDAAKNGNEPIIDFLISKGADVNHQDCNGNTPLYFALLQDHEEVVQKLLAQGASKDLALLNACLVYKSARTANADVIRWLIAKGANINTKITHSDSRANNYTIMEYYGTDDDFNREHFPGLRAILLQEEAWHGYLKARIKNLYECCCDPKKNKRKIA